MAELSSCYANQCYSALLDQSNPSSFCSSFFGTTTITSAVTYTSVETDYETVTAAATTSTVESVPEISTIFLDKKIKKRSACPAKSSSSITNSLVSSTTDFIPTTLVAATSTTAFSDICTAFSDISSACSCAGVTGPAQSVILGSSTVDVTLVSTVTVAAPPPTSTTFVLQSAMTGEYFITDERNSVDNAIYLGYDSDMSNALPFALDPFSSQLIAPSQPGLSSYPSELDYTNPVSLVLGSATFASQNRVGLNVIRFAFNSNGPFYPGDRAALIPTGAYDTFGNCGTDVQMFESMSYSGDCQGFTVEATFV